MRRLRLVSAASSVLCAGIVGIALSALFAWQRVATADAVGAEPGRGRTAGDSTSVVPERIEPWTGQEFRLRQRLLEIASEYRRYGRVDDEARWAPELCRMPFPSIARFSAADGREGHGQKLYFLFARDRAGYVSLHRPKDPIAPAFQVGAKGEPQVVVKEAWLPEEHHGKKPPEFPRDVVHDGLVESAALGGSYYPYAGKDGKIFRAAKKAGLFVMFQADHKPAAGEARETDDGWLYGTLTADGKTVTAAGKIQSCMECHQQAPHGRLFGLSGKSDRRR